MQQSIQVRPLTSERWGDLTALFGEQRLLVYVVAHFSQGTRKGIGSQAIRNQGVSQESHVEHEEGK